MNECKNPKNPKCRRRWEEEKHPSEAAVKPALNDAEIWQRTEER